MYLFLFFMNDLQVIILAAGAGTRMGINMPKVLTPVHGKPLIFHLLETLEDIGLAHTPVIVVGHKAEEVKTALGDRYRYVHQTERKGTAHAVASAKHALRDSAPMTISFFGDTPFISKRSIRALVEKQRTEKPPFTMGTVRVPHFDDWYKGFFDFGRIIRNDRGQIINNIEKKQFTNDIASIQEVNPGFYCFDSSWLWENIDSVPPTPPANEHYLPHVITIALEQNRPIASIDMDPAECLGANTPEHLRAIERLLSEKTRDRVGA